MNILTFDIEDWFHINFEKSFNREIRWDSFESRVEENTDIILEILEQNGTKATFFCLGWIARKHPNVLRKILGLGHDIASHSDIHNLASNLSVSEFEMDLKKSIYSIEDITGKKISMYRAPAFSIGKNNLWAFEILAQNGIEIDCSVFPAKHDFGGFADIGETTPFRLKYNHSILKEFPMSTANVFGKNIVITGGGFFRLYPYWLIRRHISDKSYIMTYFHPRDIDKEQPILKGLSHIRKFKSYYGLKYSLNKFSRLISEFNFLSISEADKLITWNDIKLIDIN